MIAIGLRVNGQVFHCGQGALFMTTSIVPYSKQIPLSQGKFTTVSYWFYDWLSQWRWYVRFDGHNWYACRKIYIRKTKKEHMIHMHRVVLNPFNKKIVIDHINRNGLDNTEPNLRSCTQAQNVRNKSSKINGTSKFLGVHFDSETKMFRGRITIPSGKQINKRFDNEIDAAKWRDEQAKKYHREFANLNFK